MNVFINFDPDTTLDLFHPNKNDFKKDELLKKCKLEKWPIGKMIKK